MKSDRSAYFPIGLVLGAAVGGLFGNAALGAFLGLVTGLLISNSGHTQKH